MVLKTEHGYIKPQHLEEEMRTSYMDYAMSVIVSRALPDVRDGLKPVPVSYTHLTLPTNREV
mgnify:CR=1 FL=1